MNDRRSGSAGPGPGARPRTPRGPRGRGWDRNRANSTSRGTPAESNEQPRTFPRNQRTRNIDGAGGDSRRSNRGNFQNHGNNNVPQRGNNGTREGSRPPYSKGQISGFKALESFLQKDPESLILDLLKTNSGFAKFLEDKLTNDALIVVLRILRKVCDSSFDDTKFKVLQLAMTDSFVEKLKGFIAFLPMQGPNDKKRNSYFWNDTDQFWNDILAICSTVQRSTPTFALARLPPVLDALKIYIPTFENAHNYHVNDEIKERAEQMHDIMVEMQKDLEEKRKLEVMMKKVAIGDEELEPPNDFREINVYPTALEILGQRDFLRPNVVEGPYKDVNHYLDVQFRLLREDFVGPLRKGIKSYREPASNDHRRPENIRIYKRVVFLKSETVNSYHCVRLKFDLFDDNPQSKSKGKLNFKNENSRRLMFGSLLVFTRDNFRTLVFGKVTDRKEKDLINGEIVVGFNDTPPILLGTNYMMVECSVYFEPYYHVLNVLKEMPTDELPMEKYIVKVDPSVTPPAYLNIYSVIEIQQHRFQPLVTWPNKRFYNLNDSQLEAFRAALTQEFAIVQGPPGTGKTFLGLKIAKTLLENINNWYKKTPMLVICYTNHALDQFLEGLLPFTEEIIRVGGQSKNENLARFNLRQMKKRMSKAVFEMRDNVQSVLREIVNLTANLEQVDLYTSVFKFAAFRDVVPDFHRSWFVSVSNDAILAWLMEGKPQPLRNGEQDDAFLLNLNETDEAPPIGEWVNGDDASDEEMETDVDPLLEDLLGDAEVQYVSPLITIKYYRERISVCERYLREFQQLEDPNLAEYTAAERMSIELRNAAISLTYLNERLGEGRANRGNHPRPGFVDMANPRRMRPQDRWQLYFHFLDLYRVASLEKLRLLNVEFREVHAVYEQMRDMEDTRTMRGALVIGITTTGAARMRSTLQALRSPVVIVEEAAEVLEAHIVTSISKHCRHLILIGDHQQLKPSTSDYDVERKFKLGISLFERMIMNKVQHYTLNVQHRMRPEISALVAPAIYPNLENHDSVFNRPPIKGIDNNLFFIDHQNREDNCDGTSKKNLHEARFLIGLASHLILNGYRPSQITILAAYLGQMFEMQRQRSSMKILLGDVRIAVLDNYQGEECDIILLSTVRNNDENKIGFLSIENRVCVALSRARDGFYLMGNMEQLCSRSDLWRKIRGTLTEQKSLGEYLPLRCQVHPLEVTYVKTYTDFHRIPEGGCTRKCEADLVCGHTCSLICHVLDREHVSYKCPEICNKKLCDKDETHICKQPCYKQCVTNCDYVVTNTLPCGHVVDMFCHLDPASYDCPVLVTTTLPCGHVADKPCFRDADTFPCPHPCDFQVQPCGHACVQKCHIRKDPDHLTYKCLKRCARKMEGCTAPEEGVHPCSKLCFEDCDKCGVLVKKPRTVCPHMFTVACREDVDLLKCEKPCKKPLPCGHKCKSRCCDPCNESRCEVKVTKIVAACGHRVDVQCDQQPDRKLCKGTCPLALPCGHPCTRTCKEPCTEKCVVGVASSVRGKCGHVITRLPCHLNGNPNADPEELLQHCTQPCGAAELKCKHPCQGTCGKCSQGRIHQRCAEQCGVPLVCNHLCAFPCRRACRPCSKPCEYRCRHSACKKRCGEPCTPCKEPCPRRCPHVRCPKYCGLICDVDPCTEPCAETLACGHDCIGFCGDPCPPKCLVCDEDELLTPFFGTEEKDSRFVLLEDCGHVLESEGLEHWLRDSSSVGFKTCPLCKSPIKRTERFRHYVKRALQDVNRVKVKLHGSEKENEVKRQGLETRLFLVGLGLGKLSSENWKTLLSTLHERIGKARQGKRQPIDQHELNAFTSKLQIMEYVVEICRKVEFPSSAVVLQIEFIASVLLRDENYISDQEIDDLQHELDRLTRIVDLNKIEKTPHYVNLKNTPKVASIRNQIDNIVFGHAKYNARDDASLVVFLKALNAAVASGVGISEKEKREILTAMDFQKGHWFKCPNGHIYAIGECGGAMQVSKCNECGAAIGGQSHALLVTNAVATEMDGARHSALFSPTR